MNILFEFAGNHPFVFCFTVLIIGIIFEMGFKTIIAVVQILKTGEKSNGEKE